MFQDGPSVSSSTVQHSKKHARNRWMHWIWRIVWVMTDSQWKQWSQSGSWSVKFLLLLPFVYILETPSSASFQLFPLCPEDSPSLVHFFPPGQATHLLPPVFHFFIFPFHLASPLTAPLSFIRFSTFTLLHSFFSIHPHPSGNSHSSNLTCFFAFIENQSPHTLSLVQQCDHLFLAIFLDCLTSENGTDRLFQNTSNQLPTYAT